MSVEKTQPTSNIQLENGTYEIIRDRLSAQSNDLNERLLKLNDARKEIFGSIETKLIGTDRISTENNCLSRDIISVNHTHFLFGYNVYLGLKTETLVSDVFSCYSYDTEKHLFQKEACSFLEDENFKVDFANLYKYYKGTRFVKFAEIGPHVFMVFQIGKTSSDVKTFKWAKTEKGLSYLDNRSDHEYVYPNQHEFQWKRAVRDMHRKGEHPHISIEDRVFVETIGGDLTIKVEDNTNSGKGIYEEAVEDSDQTLDDAEIYYAVIGNLIVLKIRPYQEESNRYILYNEKIQEAIRIDALENSCVFLPDDQGLIFANGYYVQTGEFKLFDNQLDNMTFEKRLISPNGEDFLYVFYQKSSGIYALLHYNLIDQEVKTPIICNGYSIFEDGELIYFKAEEEQKKHHLIQIWQTPFHSPNKTQQVSNASFLFKVGNKDVVRAMAESRELIKLIQKEDSYANLYVDLSKNATDILDSYHWLGHEEAFHLEQPLILIKESASTAIEEYEKVVRIKRDSKQRLQETIDQAKDVISKATRGDGRSVEEYIERLQLLRVSKGEVLALKDLRYVDLNLVESYEQELTDILDKVSQACVRFLLRKEALLPYQEKVKNLQQKVDTVDKVVKAGQLEEEVLKVSKDLELLIEVVSNLKIDDATQTTRIIESISAIYSQFNQINSALKKKRKELIGKEGEAEFISQIKLVNQGLTNYIDISDTPEKCDEYLNKLMVQLEELEGKFVEFDRFLELITQKREEVYNAFENKRLQLTEARNRRTLSLQQSAERIVSGIAKRLSGFKTVKDINAYYASDIMVSKVRDIADQLLELGDSVKSDDVQSRLKSVYENAIRQLRDKTDLFVDGGDTIKLGKHQFNVNTQNLDLTLVQRDEDMYFHLTGTNFFEKLEDQELESTRSIWDQSLVSENKVIYRGEYLAYQIYQQAVHQKEGVEHLIHLTEKELLKHVQEHMASKFDEGYIKGVHDHDATLIFQQLLSFHQSLGLLKYDAKARVVSYLWWTFLVSAERKKLWKERFHALRSIAEVFGNEYKQENVLEDLRLAISDCEYPFILDEDTVEIASEYVYQVILGEVPFSHLYEAWHFHDEFQQYLKKQRAFKRFEDSLLPLVEKPHDKFELIQSWLLSFSETQKVDSSQDIIMEVAAMLMHKQPINLEHKPVSSILISGFNGDHPVLNDKAYSLSYAAFMRKLKRYNMEDVPKFKAYVRLKKELLEKRKDELRLEAFKPKVLSSFVRNKLIDEVYLSLIGDNLAKQIGAAGDAKRTDLMGMLLLISPPGYGKTTLMEYVANRLGLIFVKINGPAIGHQVTSVDPAAAANSSAREELKKLNLAFEMGDNVMIYIDDIQHCNPEFLQKFISLCDAQRKIEGIYKGKSKTYDLRGRKVAVVMAGNPYTESGEKFQIPDMLANRADIYNLGDIIGGKSDVFEMSYIENSLTSNSVLEKLRHKNQSDIYVLMEAAKEGNSKGLQLEGNHTPEEVKEYVVLMRMMITVRDIVLCVNKEYIDSAAQAEEYRTEPPFKLQGSYRDMNKMVEKLSPLMNEQELKTLILSHYENESQTLTQAAEFNKEEATDFKSLPTKSPFKRFRWRSAGRLNRSD